jgi:hypothetical protein
LANLSVQQREPLSTVRPVPQNTMHPILPRSKGLSRSQLRT